jgi:plastocyanin
MPMYRNNRVSRAFGRSIRFGTVIAIAALTMLAPGSMAQTPAADMAAEAHPAHIHSGTCAELGDVVLPLTDVTTAPADAEMTGAASAHAVKTSETLVDMPLQEIIDGGHAINVHLSAEEIGTYIACGDIGGVVTTDEGGRTSLVIGLGELNDSGHHGVAWLGDAGEQTEVSVILIEPEVMATANAASQEPSSDATPDSATSIAVEIKDFAFNPATIDVPVGGSITWTNQDNSPHTATGLDRDLLQSGTLAFGETYTQTFDTAGSYDYFCEFHANMKGTIVVE